MIAEYEHRWDAGSNVPETETLLKRQKRTIEELSRNIREQETSRWRVMLPNCCLTLDACSSDNLIDENFVLWQRELQALPPEDQDQIYRDMYGESEPLEETQEMVQQKLAQLSQLLRARSREEEARAYVLAMEQAQEKQQQDPNRINVDSYYVASDDYQIMFLRSTNWDTIEAANKLVRFMQLKLELFGESKLSKRITLEDLDQDDRASLEAGCGTFCGRDKAGRALIFVRHQWYRYKNVHNLIRAMYYGRLKHLESSTITQQNGIVVIFFNVGHYPGDQAHLLTKAAKQISHFNAYGPFKVVAGHHCHDNFIEQQVWRMIRMFMPAKQRQSYHRIVGNEEECLLKLMTYGIPVEQLNHEGWYPVGSDDGRNDVMGIFPTRKVSEPENNTAVTDEEMKDASENGRE
jgi:hypothetical protein